MDDPRGYDSSIRDELDQQDWEEAIARALKHAVFQSRLSSWLGFEVEPEELVGEAIAKTYGAGSGASGKVTYRNWTKEKYPQLADFLINIIDSIISQRAEHYSKFVSVALDPDADAPATADERNLEAQLLADPNQVGSPEESMVGAQRTAALNAFLRKLSDEDEEIGVTLMAIEEVGGKAAAIADATGYSVEAVYNITKRLRRKLRQFISEQESGQMKGRVR